MTAMTTHGCRRCGELDYDPLCPSCRMDTVGEAATADAVRYAEQVTAELTRRAAGLVHGTGLDVGFARDVMVDALADALRQLREDAR